MNSPEVDGANGGRAVLDHLLAITLTVGEALVVAKAAKVATTTNAKASIRKIKLGSIIPAPIWDTKLRPLQLRPH